MPSVPRSSVGIVPTICVSACVVVVSAGDVQAQRASGAPSPATLTTIRGETTLADVRTAFASGDMAATHMAALSLINELIAAESPSAARQAGRRHQAGPGRHS